MSDCNLKLDVFENWNCKSDEAGQSLGELYKSCLDLVSDCVAWYDREKASVSNFAKLLRFFAIAISGIAGLLLICSQQPEGISSGWANAAITIAGTLVAIDRFFGYTESWIRFTESANRLRTMTRRFKLDWESQRLNWIHGIPNAEQAESAVKLADSFVSGVDSIVTNEIDDWAARFRSNALRQERSHEDRRSDSETVTESTPINPTAPEVGNLAARPGKPGRP